MVGEVGEVPEEHGRDALAQEHLVVAAALEGMLPGLPAAGRERAVVQRDARDQRDAAGLLLLGRDLARAPLGVRVGRQAFSELDRAGAR